MRVIEGIFLVLLIKLINLPTQILSNEVQGCGGFIKSHADIDFSKVEIKLLTKQGSLKDKTDCSPSNGYYFLPIYDKGEYNLRIAPPPGWSFEPEQVALDFDGKSDICSQGKDVNFVFKGFGITGKVALAGQARGGAQGVDIKLKSEDGSDVRTTKTDVNGVFSFTPIIPGKYIISASHAKWHFFKNEHNVVVVSGNTVLPEDSLVVSGFDVAGHFDSNDQLTSLGVALFKKKGQTLPLKCTIGASSIKLDVSNNNFESTAVCYAQVDKSGVYLFPGVAPGTYIVQPVVQNKDLKLHINPKSLEFTVGKDTLELKDIFKITGFSVSGRVLSSPDGKPLPKAIIKVNGKHVTETKADGSYILEHMKTGAYTIQVEAHKLRFAEQHINLQLTQSTIPDILPTGIEVCGTVVSEKSFIVGITKHASTFHTTVSTEAITGDWCTYLPSGKFSIEVLTTDAEKSSGIQFFPVQQNIEVKWQPLRGITFSQLRATLNGELKCLPDAPKTCTEAEVTMYSLDAAGQPTGVKSTTDARDGKYIFNEVLPGPYEITISQSHLCFDSTRVLINVASAKETVNPFVQRGYEVSIISSHRAIMKYTYTSITTSASSPTPQTSTSADTLKLLSGVNTFCVPKFGSYKMKLEGCHLYDDTLPKTFTTSDSSPIIINAVAHKIGVRVLAAESNVGDIQLGVDSNSLGQKLVTPIAESHKVDGKFAFRFDTHLKPEEVLHITPKSKIFLFTPEQKELIGGNDCVDIAFNFVAKRGLILQGKTVPPIKDVKVTLSFPNNAELSSESVQTAANGEFKFGPIDENLVFQLVAEKESYVFSDYDRKTSVFNAHKLCEIAVSVKDEEGNPLSGVLLSLSGGESYRKNLIAGDNGAISFHSLSPSKYFLRPMMKEFKFEPNSKMIEIADGETIEVELVGRRVAYSVFGKINSLNGESFPDVNIEAVADDQCMNHQEEATSEDSGQYRLRGLQSSCNYIIRLKDARKPGSNVERSIPKQRTIAMSDKDVRDINFIAISPMTIVDVTARITAALNEHYKTLRLVMYRKGEPDSPVYSQRVESPLNPKARYNPGIMVFFPRIPLDGKTYIVELRTSLSDKTYTYKPLSQQFIANKSSIFVELDFSPQVRTTEADLNQNSISALVLVALVVIAFFKQDIAMDFLNFAWAKVNSIIQDISQSQKNNRRDVRRAEQISQKEIEHMADQINSTKKKKTKKI